MPNDVPMCKLLPQAIPDDDLEAWLDSLGEETAGATPEAEAFFERRRQLGLGVGATAAGKIVRQGDLS